jgi:hypothetical protein
MPRRDRRREDRRRTGRSWSRTATWPPGVCCAGCTWSDPDAGLEPAPVFLPSPAVRRVGAALQPAPRSTFLQPGLWDSVVDGTPRRHAGQSVRLVDDGRSVQSVVSDAVRPL